MADRSRRRRVARTVLRGLQLAVYLLFFGAVVFFALTRTEVGRDELRQQVQAQFAERFAGSLQIGTLRGNLLNVLYASDVEIRGPDGGVVAAVDSVPARSGRACSAGPSPFAPSRSFAPPSSCVGRRTHPGTRPQPSSAPGRQPEERAST